LKKKDRKEKSGGQEEGRSWAGVKRRIFEDRYSVEATIEPECGKARVIWQG
jgi:hypothetical protein